MLSKQETLLRFVGTEIGPESRARMEAFVVKLIGLRVELVPYFGRLFDYQSDAI